jgi:hypothetical protein
MRNKLSKRMQKLQTILRVMKSDHYVCITTTKKAEDMLDYNYAGNAVLLVSMLCTTLEHLEDGVAMTRLVNDATSILENAK